MAAKKHVSFPDMTITNLTQEIVCLRAEVKRLNKVNMKTQTNMTSQENSSKGKDTQILQLKDELETLVAWKTAHLGSENALKSELRNSKIRETKSRAAKEFLSVELVLKNVNNSDYVEKIRSLEAEIEKREASEEEKLILLNRQKEALSRLWQKERESKSRKTSGSILLGKIDKILDNHKAALTLPSFERETASLSEVQDKVCSLVDRSKHVVNMSRCQAKRTRLEENLEVTVVTKQCLVMNMFNGQPRWSVKSTDNTFLNNPSLSLEEEVSNDGISDESLLLPSLDELLTEIRSEQSTSK